MSEEFEAQVLETLARIIDIYTDLRERVEDLETEARTKRLGG